jgi:hypothetical protein
VGWAGCIARDTRLGREVAIKVLPETVEQDLECIARFEREAKALADAARQEGSMPSAAPAGGREDVAVHSA